MEKERLEVGIYQIVDDAVLKKNRNDGTGWEWGWADWQRDWMDATPNRFAYRCLPLTIINQTGWWVKNPVGLTATWNGQPASGNIAFRFDAAGDLWKSWVDNQFGAGIITWNTPFLFRTKPRGSRLLVVGPANHFKANAHPLTALIESDWMSMSFTMNYKIMTPNQPVRFEQGEPLFQAIPLSGDTCVDLEEAAVTYMPLAADPEVHRSYEEWHVARRQFHEMKARGEVKPDEWQKDYFQGRDMAGRVAPTVHKTKVKPPRIQFGATPPSARDGDAPHPQTQVVTPAMHPTDRSPEMDANPGDRSVTATLSAPAEAEAHAPEPESSAPAATRMIDDEWRRWIAENLMIGGNRESLIVAMTAGGVAPDEAAREIDLAAQSPYVRGSERLRNRLRKRDWLLATYRKNNRLHSRSGEVERRHKLSREAFLNDYYSANRAVIITGMMDDWPAMRKWNLDYFADQFGDREVEVQHGRNSGENYEIEREKFIRRLKFAEYVEQVRTAGVTNDFYLTANNNSSNRAVLTGLWDDIVQIPEYLDGRDAGGKFFFWFGPAGTITPFHHDLTNNFMAQVIGRKRVKIAPSWDIPLMVNELHCFSRVDGRVTPAAPRPAPDAPQILECVIGPGDILFLPVGCMHYVEGVDISVTVSFTNFAFDDNDYRSFYTTYHGV